MFNPPQGERYAGMRYGQGVILTFDPDTFENTVGFRGLTLTNVPILNGPDALTYQAGTVIALVGWAPNGGFGAWWILGRVITPGSGASEQAIDFLQTALGAAVARGVIGESFFFDQNFNDSIRTNFGTFGDLETRGTGVADPGPTVSFDLTGDKFLAVWGSPTLSSISGTEEARAEGYMSVEASGASLVSPSITRSVTQDTQYPSVSGAMLLVDSGVSAHMFTGMSPGSYTVQAKYRIDNQGSSDLADIAWRNRWLLVIAF